MKLRVRVRGRGGFEGKLKEAQKGREGRGWVEAEG